MLSFPQKAIDEAELSRFPVNRFKKIFDTVSAGVNLNTIPVSSLTESILSIKDNSIRYDALFSLMLNLEPELSRTSGLLNFIDQKDTQEMIDFVNMIMTVLGNMVFNEEVIRYINRVAPTNAPAYQKTQTANFVNFHDKIKNLFVGMSIQWKQVSENSSLTIDQKKMIMKNLQPEFILLIRLLKEKAHPSMMAIENLSI